MSVNLTKYLPRGPHHNPHHILANFLSEMFLTEWLFSLYFSSWLGVRAGGRIQALLFSSPLMSASLFNPSLAHLYLLEALMLPQEVWRVYLALKLAGVRASIYTVINKGSTWLIFNVKALSKIDCKIHFRVYWKTAGGLHRGNCLCCEY